MKCKLMILALAAVTAFCSAEVIKSLVATSVTFDEVPIGQVPWEGFDQGFAMTPEGPCLENSAERGGRRGVGKVLVLNQRVPRPVKVRAESKSEAVGGSPSSAYSIYLDVIHMDGTPQWGIVTPFSVGTHGWEQKEVLYIPSKPIKHLRCWLLLRVPGKVWFRNLTCCMGREMPDAKTFDGQTVIPRKAYSGWMLRDVKATSDFLSCQTPRDSVLGVKLDVRNSERQGARMVTATLEAEDKTRDRILNVTYVQTLPEAPWAWLTLSREAPRVVTRGEYSETSFSRLGSNGMCSKVPFVAVAAGERGRALGMDLQTPAHGRMFYHASTRELAVTWDVALTPEQPKATLRLLDFDFQATWGLRSAYAKLYRIYPELFVVRVKRQGLWMPFAPISQIEGFEDFGFAVKEGNSETAWDDRHGILTFRYTEPMTWWMRLPEGTRWTMAAILKEVEAQSKHPKGKQARTFRNSVFLDAQGQSIGRMEDTPWCKGIVWSMNSMPGIAGEHTDFKLKWNANIKEELYGPKRKGDLDGEYVDSSEGYVTHVIDHNRAHFAAARTPLTYAHDGLKPGIFRGLIAYEYVKALADDLHPMGKLVMANSTPSRIWFLAPQLDVLGSESNWNPNGTWQPPDDQRLLTIRSLCGAKPFCFLQNTNFDLFPQEKVERFMKRSLFYGMYPGFFSANAATKQYFRNPKLYNRDRALFKKYVPLCRLVGEAGWQPETNAWSNHGDITVERYGENLFTVFNQGSKTAAAILDFRRSISMVETLLGTAKKTAKDSELAVTLDAEDVLVLRVNLK